MLQTPSQTVGPYFAYGLTPEQYLYDFKSLVGNQLVDPLNTPDAITITGRVFDGQGQPIADAMIELWDPANKRFGRFGTGTDPQNRFVFQATKPGSVDGQAPHFWVIVFMRGQLIHSYTRLYFADEADLNAADPLLNTVPTERRATLLAQKAPGGYTFDIFMQGDNETVFFEV
ncbi:protocatechuate 3,4-dioxygenase subunit alpha [Rudanella paleaurantiibacter]|uniref:Protocatechuate 3,4-dioxygenase subunit alpha n=1 Tax=Rudanella paleaurantiibacter TaxID=2614655 RepID=A0A7J5TUE9_9BACT|nr:protocatechuate 3,4-dioxygenase subunit alpha [Rudanella paleaurantiibacter]KAB7727626.1 protocatechuate 3,4-dioxygenase subunit alpha [Rudanella paleaurantiibacter]